MISSSSCRRIGSPLSKAFIKLKKIMLTVDTIEIRIHQNVQQFSPATLTSTNRRKIKWENIPNRSCSPSDVSWSCPDCVFRLDRRHPYCPTANCTIHMPTTPPSANWIKRANSGRWPILRPSRLRVPPLLVSPSHSASNNIVVHSNNRIPHPTKWSPAAGRKSEKRWDAQLLIACVFMTYEIDE